MGTACTVNLYLIFYIYNMKVCLYCNSIDENFNVHVNGPNCTGQGVCVWWGWGWMGERQSIWRKNPMMTTNTELSNLQYAESSYTITIIH